MKDAKIFDLLKNADDDTLNTIAERYPAADSSEREKIYSMTMKKCGSTYDLRREDSVSGVERNRRPRQRGVAVAASVIAIIIGITGAFYAVNPPRRVENGIDSHSFSEYYDAQYMGEVKQKIANGCDFIDTDEHPYLIYDRYVTEDGQEFCFDKQGRLCKYKNTDSIFYGRTSADNGKQLTDDKIEAECYKIAMKYLEKGYIFETDFNEESGVLHIDGVNERCSDYRESATVRMNRSGEICSISVRYNTLKQPVDDETRAYFESRINEYMKNECERLNDDRYECGSARYEQIGSRLYAIYTCSFYDISGAVYCESAGFCKDLEATVSADENLLSVRTDFYRNEARR